MICDYIKVNKVVDISCASFIMKSVKIDCKLELYRLGV